jgi:hypothetical protein
METIYRSCCGLDVHSKSLAACVRRVDERGQVHEEVRSFGTMTRDLLALRDWLARACHARGHGVHGGVLEAGL